MRELRDQWGWRIAAHRRRAQEVAVVMVGLLERQREDTSLPLNDRWEEISGWLDLTAGQLRGARHRRWSSSASGTPLRPGAAVEYGPTPSRLYVCLGW